MTNFRVCDRIFKSIEHGYQWYMAMHLGLSNTASRIMTACTARYAKYIANDELSTKGQKQAYSQIWCYAWTFDSKSRTVPRTFRYGDEKLIEDTSDDYWPRVTIGHGSNILSELLMLLRDTLTSSSSSFHAYCPPSNGVILPCYNCGEGNHNKDSCWYHAPLQCRSCFRMGHKMKHCSASYQDIGHEGSANNANNMSYQ